MPLKQPFVGFALPTSNTTYTPNQFFDVCLPHYSRGAVRLVAFMIRKTLGWCDEQGNPQEVRHAVSYADFEQAGISRGMIRRAIEDAVKGQFIRCVEKPQSKKVRQAAISGSYELNWEERAEYVKDPQRFRGFFAGEGNRTYIPNQFFDQLVPIESLAVLKVVGSVTRFSIGFANKWGHRRRNVALSYQHIQNYARIHDRPSLSAAIQHAMRANYIERVEEGYFDPNAGKLSKAAVYALRWVESVQKPSNTATETSIGMKTLPAVSSRKNRFENPTGIGMKTLPGDRYENPTDIEIKQTNKTSKQQQPIAATFERLKAEGFDTKAAQAIASTYPAERIERQIAWLARRKVKSNRLGLLRTAIEQDWSAPASGGGGQFGAPNSPARPRGASFSEVLEARRQRLAASAPAQSTTPRSSSPTP